MKQEWDLEELIETFSLLAEEIALLTGYKAHNRLGQAVLFKFFQHAGRFPDRPDEVPPALVAFIAQQLRVSPDVYGQYDWRGSRIKAHRATIRQWFGFRPTTEDDQAELVTWLVESVLPQEHRPHYLRAMVYQRLRGQRIEPPAPGRVERLVTSALHTYETRLFATTLEKLPARAKNRLMDLVYPERPPNEGEDPDEPARYPIHDLKAGPGKANVKNLKQAAARLETIKDVGLPDDLFGGIPLRFLKIYRNRVSVEAISHLRRHPPATGYALLAAFCWMRGRDITDDLVEIFLQIVHGIGLNAEKKVDKVVLAEVKRVYGKERLFHQLAQAMLDHPDGVIREVLYPLVGEERLHDLVREFQMGASYQVAVRTVMHGSYNHHYRQMLPHLLGVLEFRSNNVRHRPVLDGVEVVKRYIGSKRQYYPLDEVIPIEDVIPSGWQDWVTEKDDQGQRRVMRARYELCVLQALRERLRRRAIWVVGSDRYRNPDHDLPADFEDKRELYYQALGLPQAVDAFVHTLKTELEEALQTLDEGLPDNPHVAITTHRGGWIRLSPLAALPRPATLEHLKREIRARWPVELIDILKEVDLRVGFTDYFTTLGAHEGLERNTLRRRLLLCLFGLGTNTGLLPVSRGRHGESYDALRYVRKRYIHADALRQAIAAGINATLTIRHPRIWGDATTACASDARKFAARDQNLLTQWHNRYRGPGVMVYWHIERRALCIYSQLKTPSSSEVAAMIEGVLRHCTQMQIEKNYVDTHGQSEVAFAFCHLLGFELLPRIKDIYRQKLYRPRKGDPDTYPNLQPVLTRPIRWELIRKHYDQMVKYATALRLGTADAEAILKRFVRRHPQHPTYRALAELGKVIKTIFLCRYLASEELRREIQEGLNVVENWNSATRFLFYGNGSEISPNDLDAQEVAMLSLHLLQVCLVYVNTLLLQEVLAEPEWYARMTHADWRGLTPLFYRHVNPIGIIELDMDRRIPIAYQGSAA